MLTLGFYKLHILFSNNGVLMSDPINFLQRLISFSRDSWNRFCTSSDRQLPFFYLVTAPMPYRKKTIFSLLKPWFFSTISITTSPVTIFLPQLKIVTKNSLHQLRAGSKHSFFGIQYSCGRVYVHVVFLAQEHSPITVQPDDVTPSLTSQIKTRILEIAEVCLIYYTQS